MQKLLFLLALLASTAMAAYGQWTPKNIQTSATLTSVDFSSNELGFVTGANKIYKTLNGGANWTNSYIANSSVFYEEVFAIDSMHIIAVGKNINSNQSVITRTENGGLNWTNISLSGSSFLKSVFFPSPNIGYCSGGEGVILKSVDGGLSWQALNSGTTYNLEAVYFSNDLSGIAVGGDPSNAVIVKTEDGGATWTPQTAPSDNNLQSVFFTNAATGYIVGWNGAILKTENGGATWGYQQSVAMNGNLKVVFTDKQTGYIVGGAQTEALIQKTTNGGALWQDISPAISAGLVSIDFPSFDVGYTVGNNGTVLKTVSGGVPTATDELESAQAFRVFPNPVSEVLRLVSESGRLIDKVRIFDSGGRLLREEVLSELNPALDMSDLAPDVYYLEVCLGEMKSICKIVKS